MRITAENTDSAVLEELGRRLVRVRISLGMTQEALAAEAGVSSLTVARLEQGLGSKLTTLIRVLRVLGLIDALDHLVPEDSPSPIELIETEQRRARKRVSTSRRSHKETRERPWEWGDKA